MTPKLLALALLATGAGAIAQDFPGYRAGNYTGVNGVFFNPATIADSRYRFDLNLASAAGSIGNNQATFNLKDVVNAFNADRIEDELAGRNAGPSSALASASLHGPSFMFNAGRKTAIAFTTRARIMANIIDLDGKLADKLLTDFNGADPDLPYTINSASNTRVNINAWTELGLSVGRVVWNNGLHFLKTGVSLKYLAGAGNAYINLNGINATLDDDARGEPYLINTSGRVAMGFGGISIADVEPEDVLQMETRGFGADVGFVYEYWPESDEHQLGETGTLRRDVNKYKFKAGLALLDVGGMRYQRDVQRSGGYTINIAGTDTLRLVEFENEDIDSYKEFFDSKPQYFTPDATNATGRYKVGLPTTLQLNFDYHLHRGFYVDMALQLALSNSKSKPHNSSYYSGLTCTPRYEGRKLGLYFPVNFNGLTKFNAGAALRIGPLFVGSSSVLTALLGNSKQADAYAGFRFGILQKKAHKELKKIERKEDRREKRTSQQNQ